MMVRDLVLFMLLVTVIAPILLYTCRLGSFNFSSCKFYSRLDLLWPSFLLPYSFSCFLFSFSARDEFLEDFSSFVSGIVRFSLYVVELSELMYDLLLFFFFFFFLFTDSKQSF